MPHSVILSEVGIGRLYPVPGILTYRTAMANETWKFVQAKSRQAMKQVLGIKDEAARMTMDTRAQSEV